MPETRAQSKNVNMKRAALAKSRPALEKGRAEASGNDQDQPDTKQISRSLAIIDVTGDLTTDPPDNSILIHSVNCAGEWGSGVALALAKALPGAYEVYADHCNDHDAGALLGSCLLIPPCEVDQKSGKRKVSSQDQSRRWVACLFSSESYGRKTKSKAGKSSPNAITANTERALHDLRRQLEGYPRESNAGNPRLDLQELWACKFNSGSFGVKWEATVKIIQEVFEGWDGEMKVVSHG